MSNEPFVWSDELAIKFAADFAAQRLVGDDPVNVQEFLEEFKQKILKDLKSQKNKV